ncbi:bifunctional adenosylcobinamide kinase/adenosylcobinamide-phosphate guanylyltransferase [Commensalibacter oyaizuii]|uniref:Bifunctional adenosylcobalamin biosynthesis protein n=1 Tax=Commensalibacter oyaizuii TaxID=3043873 RepID=A0ABT6Q1D9_9PROT|nr:bifunctional adenosylcobinamide kinase/adenosylcobinamide-phosphate guanylyltransferase [Commensalibacter sp. TBRC 16381]MDI2090920.1 bifunctional adenosylcobinamide kinase/adenosylcobinamide-phosphate guanylyltransferase [Commensalibacter sp. TBRC 16381]
MISFILGGAKSGKSGYAEEQIMQLPAPWIYLATGRAWDDEMQQKIINHQKRRGQGWQTIEVPIQIAKALQQLNKEPVLIDCLTLWLTNLMMDHYHIDNEIEILLSGLKAYQGDIVIVSNEVGQGIVPIDPMARAFRNHAGVLHQKVAKIADRFTCIIAGYPVFIKP